jgi:hypothetical protein
MLNFILLYLGATLTAFWGVAHLVPTKSVVSGFGPISRENQHIITMEWTVEGVALIFIGLLVAAVAQVDAASAVSKVVFILSTFVLLTLAIVSLFTGFRVKFFPFKLCPLIFTVSALLILFGGVIL